MVGRIKYSIGVREVIKFLSSNVNDSNNVPDRQFHAVNME